MIIINKQDNLDYNNLIDLQFSLQLSNIPKEPGVYLFKDKSDNLLYVGKSKNLKNRIRSYFRDKNSVSPRINLMVRQIKDLEIIVTDTEAEALTLESNLIKEKQPHFNILLKDDKKYPYVCITWSEKYPRIYITRRRRNRNHIDRYYGPYVDVNLIRNTLYLVKKVFPIRQRNIPLYKDRTCLNYSIGRCPGVCQELVTPEEYKSIILKIAMIFQGRVEELKDLLSLQMNKFSENLDYERAAKVRDQIVSLDNLNQNQNNNQKMIIPNSSINRDVIALSKDNNIACIQLFQMRAGKLVGRIGFTDDAKEIDSSLIIQKVIEDYYARVDPIEIPKEILIQHDFPQLDLITDWICELKSSKVSIIKPKQGLKKSLINLVEKNAIIELERIKNKNKLNSDALDDLSELLDISEPVRRIEAYDISHIQGTNVVGSQVVFIDGIPAKQHYRIYKIKSNSISAGHSDDYMALAEVIRRRFRKWSQAKKSGLDIIEINKNNNSTLHTQGLNDWPNLILIDGGKGQLSTVIKVLKSLDLENEVKVCSLSKKNEDLFIPNFKDPVDSQKEQPALKLLRNLRDEAHRFAVSHHRKIRNTKMKRSRLSDIPGVGPIMIKELLNHFRSIDAIQIATINEICKVNGMGNKKAELIWKYFHDSEL